ncbi:MAG: NAD(+) diphosphatase [Candidatus Nanopelagicales bacterium]
MSQSDAETAPHHTGTAQFPGAPFDTARPEVARLDVALGRPGPDRRPDLRRANAAGALAALPAAVVALDESGKWAVTGDSAHPELWRGDPADVPGQRLFLGVSQGVALFAALVGQWQPSAVAQWRGLRSIGGLLCAEDSALATTATALANWHHSHTHCPRCGTPTEVAGQGWWRHCPQDSTDHFPRTDPAMIVLLLDRADNALLARAGRWVEGAYSTLAGFIEPGETAEGALVREVSEEVALDAYEVTYLGSQPWPFPASLMLGYHARVAGVTPDPHPDGDEIVAARWISRAELPTLCESREVRLPARVSIANRLIQAWYGAELPDHWCRW